MECWWQRTRMHHRLREPRRLGGGTDYGDPAYQNLRNLEPGPMEQKTTRDKGPKQEVIYQLHQ